jgi:ABC-type dipeptide/oligopeptide/nickel transport system permease component
MPKNKESDSSYILKLVVYLILGSIWLRLTLGDTTIPLPVGLIVGLFAARTDRFQVDRKIEFALLLVSAFVAFWLPFGLELVV